MKQIKQFCIVLVFGFLLGISDGYIALWENGDPIPVEVFPYRAEYLPSADYEALKKGIPVQDETNLQMLLEDYLS